MTHQHSCKCKQCESLRDENEKLKNQLEVAVNALQEIDKYCYSKDDNTSSTVGIISMDALMALGEGHSGA